MLTQEQIDFYQENGYILVCNLLTAEEAAVLRLEIHDVAARVSQHRNLEATWGSTQNIAGAGMTTQKTQLQHVHSVQCESAAVTRLIVDDRITSVASQIIGSPNVQLHHTKMFIKPPEKGSPFPMHQDQPFFPHDKDTMIAAIVHFDDAPLEKGCVRVVPGSHRLGALQHIEKGGWHLPVDVYPVEDALPLPAKAGDVLFFSYLTIHGSGVNTSNEARTTLLIQMRDPEDPPTIHIHEQPGIGTMLRGINPRTLHDKVDSGDLELAASGAMGMGGGMGGM